MSVVCSLGDFLLLVGSVQLFAWCNLGAEVDCCFSVGVQFGSVIWCAV